MNSLDKQYQELLKTILEHGVEKKDRTGTGTKSIFGYTIRHNMSEGFPLLTTKKVAFKTMATELLWFLRGDTNIKYLVDNGCHIWDGDCYKNFYQKSLEIKLAYESGDLLGSQPHIDAVFSNSNELIILSEEEFINKIKTDDGFARRFGGLGPIYGKQWRNWVYDKDMDYGTESSVDQIQNLINDLKTNPDSRRLMVSAWNVGEISEMVLPPCHYAFQVYTRELSRTERVENYNSKFENKIDVPFIKVNLGDAIENTIDTALTQANIPARAISLMYNARSQDVPLGTPFNLASYGLLLTIIAREVNMIPDELISNMGDCHIYLNQIDGVKELLKREPYDLPKLKISDAINFNGSIDDFLDSCDKNSFELEDYKSHPAIKIPLSN
jgi:thymidylate synthase